MTRVATTWFFNVDDYVWISRNEVERKYVSYLSNPLPCKQSFFNHLSSFSFHWSACSHTGCPKKNAPMFELAISPAKMAPEIKVR